MIKETWDTRELPILRAVYAAREKGEDLGTAAKAAMPDLDRRVYIQTVVDLGNAGYFDVGINRGGDRVQSVWINDLTPLGLRTVGAWPSGTLVDQFLRALEDRVDAEEDPDKKSALTTFLEGAYDVSKGVLAGVLTHALTRGL